MAEKSTKALENEIASLKREFEDFKKQYAVHNHTLADGTAYLRKNITLDRDQWMTAGNYQVSSDISYQATDGYNYFGFMVAGPDMTPNIVYESPDMQLDMTHIPDAAAGKFSFLTSSRSPLVYPYDNTSISTTAGGSTVTIAGYDFATNSLAGCYINIYSSSQVMVESQVIASNTSTVITISATWINSTSGGFFNIYAPVFLGRNTTIFRRLYVEEGSATGGIRFGMGLTATANHPNGLLYMDAAGDLYWKYQDGAAVKLN